MPKPKKKHKRLGTDIPLPPSSGPGSIRGGNLEDVDVLFDPRADPRTQETRIERVMGQAMATALTATKESAR